MRWVQIVKKNKSGDGTKGKREVLSKNYLEQERNALE